MSNLDVKGIGDPVVAGSTAESTMEKDRRQVMDDSITDDEAQRLDEEEDLFSSYIDSMCTIGDKFYSGAAFALGKIFIEKGVVAWRNLLRKIEGMRPAAIEAAYEQWEEEFFDDDDDDVDKLVELILAGHEEDKLAREAEKKQLDLPGIE